MVNPDSVGQPFFAKYLELVPNDFVPLTRLNAQNDELSAFLSTISEDDSLRLHPPYTWTFRQVMNHLSDCERVFCFRLLWMARGQEEPMTSFDENRFSLLANPNRLRWEQCLSEFVVVRQSSLSLIESLPSDAWHRKGLAAGFPVDVSIQAKIIFGHVEHHFRILKQRMG